MSINSYTADLGSEWDLQVGADGNLKMRSGADAVAQNVSCEGKCFKGGCYFNDQHGIEWFDDALGKKFQKSIIAMRLREAALGVQGVKSVKSVDIDSLDLDARTVTGELHITTTEDENVTARI